MKFLALFVFSVSFNASATDYEGSIFKGYSAINRICYERVLNQHEFFELGGYIGETFSPFSTNLLSLLGYLPTGQNDGERVNATPNPVNTLLYHTLFDRVTTHMTAFCSMADDPHKSRNYQESFLPYLRELCAAPLDQPLSDSLLFSLWTSIIGFEAPQSEFLAWKQYLADLDFAHAEDRTYKAIYPVFMNPYFLIEN